MTPVESIVFASSTASTGTGPGDAGRGDADAGRDHDAGGDDDGDGDEATRIEANPLAQILALDADAARAGGRRSTTIQDEQPPAHLPPVPPPPAIVLGPLRAPPPTAPPPMTATASHGLRDLGPRGFPSSPVPTVILAEPSSAMTGAAPATPPGMAAPQASPGRRGFAVAHDARTQLHGPDAHPGGYGYAPELMQTLIGAASPVAGMPAVPSVVPSGTPSGIPASTGGYRVTANPPGAQSMADLPLPAHLIGLPGFGDVSPGAPAAAASPVTARVVRTRPWFLPLVFILAVACALVVTIALARALT